MAKGDQKNIGEVFRTFCGMRVYKSDYLTTSDDVFVVIIVIVRCYCCLCSIEWRGNDENVVYYLDLATIASVVI